MQKTKQKKKYRSKRRPAFCNNSLTGELELQRLDAEKLSRAHWILADRSFGFRFGKKEWRVIQKTKTEMGGESNEIQALGKKLGTNNNDCGFIIYDWEKCFFFFFSFEVNNFILIFPFLLDF